MGRRVTMVLPQVLYLTILLNLFILSAATGGYAWTLRREHPSARILSAGLMISAFIILDFWIVAVLHHSGLFFFFIRLRFWGTALFPVLFFLFIMDYRENVRWRRYRWVFFVIPLITCVVVSLDRRNGGIFFQGWDITYYHGLPIEKRQFTGWAWVHLTYTNGLLLATLLLLAGQLRRRGTLYHEQAVVLISGLTVSFALALVAVVPVPVFEHVPNTSPLAMGMAEITFAWAIFRQRILNTFPLAYITLWQNITDAALVLNVDRVITEVNPGAVSLFKQERRAMIGQPVERVCAQIALEEEICPGAQQPSLEIGERVYDLNLSPVTLRGRLYGHVLMLHDITERILAEQRALDLAVERERAHLLSSFVRDIAHEFRTPLSVVQSSLYLLEKIPDPAAQAQNRQRIQAQADRIMTLVNSLIQMSRLDYTTRLVLKPADVNRLIDIIAERWRARMLEKEVEFRLVLDRSLPLLLLAEDEFASALHHLIDNALRYTPQGGCVTLRTTRRDSHALIEVIDTGEGIDPAVLPLIFQRLYRADDAHTLPGLGLGLPIARRIIELHQGQIEVESQSGQGSCFRVLLPLH